MVGELNFLLFEEGFPTAFPTAFGSNFLVGSPIVNLLGRNFLAKLTFSSSAYIQLLARNKAYKMVVGQLTISFSRNLDSCHNPFLIAKRAAVCDTPEILALASLN